MSKKVKGKKGGQDIPALLLHQQNRNLSFFLIKPADRTGVGHCACSAGVAVCKTKAYVFRGNIRVGMSKSKDCRCINEMNSRISVTFTEMYLFILYNCASC